MAIFHPLLKLPICLNTNCKWGVVLLIRGVDVQLSMLLVLEN
jgi:hypothetical protein